MQAVIVLSAAPLVWALPSLIVPRLMRRHGKRRFPIIGLALTALGTAVVAVNLVPGPSFAVGLYGWTLAGIGVGLAYPGLYIMATTPGTAGFGAAELASAVITAEAFGGLPGGAIGMGGLLASYLMFAVVVGVGVVVARRTSGL